jgi:hypothetical protein
MTSVFVSGTVWGEFGRFRVKMVEKLAETKKCIKKTVRNCPSGKRVKLSRNV